MARRELREFREIDVAARDDCDYSARTGDTSHGYGAGTGPRALHDYTIAFCRQVPRHRGLIEADYRRAVQESAAKLQHPGEDGAAADAIDPRRLIFHRGGYAGEKRGSEGRGGIDLSGEDS